MNAVYSSTYGVVDLYYVVDLFILETINQNSLLCRVLL